VQIHPTCIPQHGDQQSKLTLMSESLRNDGRVWVPRRKEDVAKAMTNPNAIPEADRDYYLERKYPAFGNLVPRDIASRNAKVACDDGRGVVESGNAVFLDFRDAIKRLGKKTISDRYGNLFEMYERITDDSPYEVPMRIFPAVHYTMGGLWVDYNLMSNLEGLFVIGEANFSDHGSNRLGASALMQGLADGYFVLPYTIGNYLAKVGPSGLDASHDAARSEEEAVKQRMNDLLNVKGKRSPASIHRQLGQICWDKVGIARNEQGLTEAIEEIKALRAEFKENVNVPGEAGSFNQTLVTANRVADFLEIAELMARDALNRRESCGGHFREESVTAEGEALRDDENFTYVAAWEYTGENQTPVMHKEELEFEYVKLAQRSYK
jgi:succinate dehydrogenase / fumarate reductase flavoprotein subunit